MRKRDVSYDVHEHLYGIFRIPRSSSGYIRCFYCGMPADTVDHVPPISRVDDYRSMGLRHEIFIKVTCCKDCNTKLGASLQLSLVERYNVRQKQMEKEFKKILKMPVWSSEEIKKMGRNMRSSIVVSMQQKEMLKERAYFREGISDFLRDARYQFLLDSEEWNE